MPFPAEERPMPGAPVEWHPEILGLPLPEIHAVSIPRAFVRSLGNKRTYDPIRNPYFIYGSLWGLPIPIVTMAVHLSAGGMPLSFRSLSECLAQFPLHYLFLLHPILFGIIFGALGTIAHERNEQITELVGRLKTLASTDPLTGLLNRRGFFRRLDEEADRAAKEGSPISLVMIDLDHFKKYNDRHGHPAGDVELRGLAQTLQACCRSGDFVGRVGGEEFALLLPGLDSTAAYRRAEQLRLDVELRPARLTISVGIATRVPGESLEHWIETADACLYEAKRLGRNRVCLDRSSKNTCPASSAVPTA